MKYNFLKHRFQFAVPVDYSDEKAILAKIGSIIGDKNMQTGLSLMNVEEFDSIRTTICTSRSGEDVFEDIDAYPHSLCYVMLWMTKTCLLPWTRFYMTDVSLSIIKNANWYLLI